MSYPIKLGVTDRTVTVFIPDPASTDGSGKTGLVAANLTVSYTRTETDNDVVLVDATSSLNNLSALTDAHNDWGLKEVSSTLAPGLYRLDIADAVFASGAWEAVVYVMVTTSEAAATPLKFRLVAYDELDATRLGLGALPNAAAEAAGGLYTRGTGAGQINQPANGLVDVNVENWNTTAVPAEHTAGYPIVTIKDGTGTGEINTNAGAIALVDLVTTTTTATNVTTVNGLAAAVITATSIASNAITSAKLDTGCITASQISNGAIDRATFAADTGMQSARSNTAQSATSSTLVLDASASAVDDFYNDMSLTITGGTGVGQTRRIRDYTGSSKTATVTNAWVTTPDSSSTFAIMPMSSVWDELIADHLDSGSVGSSLNSAGGSGDPWSTAIPGAYAAGTAGFILGGQSFSVASGGITSASFASAAITASAIAADAIGASELAADAATEIADAVLSRNVSNVESTAGEHTLCTIVLATLESAISGTDWTIKRTDGSTTHATKTLTVLAGASPIVGVA